MSVCYHARLQKREEYENVVVKCFTGPIHLPGGVEQFRDEIRWYHEYSYLSRVSHHNTVLKSFHYRILEFMKISTL